MTLLRRANSFMGAALASLLPHGTLKALVANLVNRDATLVLEAFGPHLNRKPNLGNMPFDLPVQDRLQFENLAGLFASTSLDHGVVSMTVRQTAYLYGLVRQMAAQKVIEIGRFKGGSTLAIAAAMGG